MNFTESDCTITHEGKGFTAGGAYASDDYLIAYPASNGILQDWHGNQIGTYSVISTRPVISWQGSKYYYMRAHLNDGRFYSIRGFGVGMVAKGKRLKTK